MTGDQRYHRAGVLQEVIETANQRLDGHLPLDTAGVESTFHDVDELIGALLLRWHTRLAAALERNLHEQPTDLEAAVIRGWRETRDQLAGVRLIFDTLAEERLSPQMSAKLRVTAHKDWAMMAIMAGQVSVQDASAVPIGRRIEAKAREVQLPEASDSEPEKPRSLLARIRAALAA